MRDVLRAEAPRHFAAPRRIRHDRAGRSR
jgi:hypothetical protein